VKRIVFVTGTDTGVGKTVLTAMLLAFLRREGRNALAMKPFCSGSRGDARLLHGLQKGCLTPDEVNPFYFDKPLAPGATGKNVLLRTALGKILNLAGRCDVLVVEGVGGLLAPLGKGYTARDLIGRLDCGTILVSANRLGTINHTLLTLEALQSSVQKELKIVVMDAKKPDISAASNIQMIRRMTPGTPVYSIPYLGPRASKPFAVKKNVNFVKKTLALLTGGDKVGLVLSKEERG
jgi:dethiobiotin synthetase